jgi:hypothetical protein
MSIESHYQCIAEETIVPRAIVPVLSLDRTSTILGVAGQTYTSLLTKATAVVIEFHVDL